MSNAMTTYTRNYLTRDLEWHMERAAFWQVRVAYWKANNGDKVDVARVRKNQRSHAMKARWAADKLAMLR
jgi:hypothetical protein